MDLNDVWKQFIYSLSSDSRIKHIDVRIIVGLHFLYLETSQDHNRQEIEHLLKLYASKAMKGKQLHAETTFVRHSGLHYVYRHRFFVPQRKMFCCGNLCEDCVRLTNKDF